MFRLCFTECFSESKNGVVIMEDMDYNEVLAMLEYVCPDKNYEMRRNITGLSTNCKPSHALLQTTTWPP